MFSTCPDRPPIVSRHPTRPVPGVNTPRLERREIIATISSKPGEQAPERLPGRPAGMSNGGPNDLPGGAQPVDTFRAAAALQPA